MYYASTCIHSFLTFLLLLSVPPSLHQFLSLTVPLPQSPPQSPLISSPLFLSLSLSHTHTTGTALIKQGDTNNKFYVLNEGNALIQVDGVSVGEQLAGTFSEVLTAVAA